MELNWLDITQIILLLGACYSCFAWGRATGIGNCLEALLHRKIITEKDLDKLID